MKVVKLYVENCILKEKIEKLQKTIVKLNGKIGELETKNCDLWLDKRELEIIIKNYIEEKE